MHQEIELPGGSEVFAAPFFQSSELNGVTTEAVLQLTPLDATGVALNLGGKLAIETYSRIDPDYQLVARVDGAYLPCRKDSDERFWVRSA